MITEVNVLENVISIRTYLDGICSTINLVITSTYSRATRLGLLELGSD